MTYITRTAPFLQPAERLRVDALVLELRPSVYPADIIHMELALRRARMTRGPLMVHKVTTLTDLAEARRRYRTRIILVRVGAGVDANWASQVMNEANRAWSIATVALIGPSAFASTAAEGHIFAPVTSDWPRELAQAADLVDL